MKNVIFNGSDSKSRGLRILNWERDPLPEMRDQYEFLPNRHGFVFFGQPFGSRVNSVEFRLYSQTDQERQEKISEIMSWLHTSDLGRLEFDDEPDIFYRGKLNETEVTNITHFYTDFIVEWICYPFKIAKEESVEEFEMDGVNPVTINVGGTQETPPLINITVLEDVTNFTISVNDEELRYDGAIQTNNQIVIDTNELEFRLNDEIRILELSGLLPILRPGSNEINVSVNAKTVISWRDYYK